MNAYGTAPFSRIHAIAQHVSSPPENAIPTRSPAGSEPRIAPPLVRSEVPAPAPAKPAPPLIASLRQAYGSCSRRRPLRLDLLGELRAGRRLARDEEDGVLPRDG